MNFNIVFILVWALSYFVTHQQLFSFVFFIDF